MEKKEKEFLENILKWHSRAIILIKWVAIFYENTDYLTIKLPRENEYLVSLEELEVWGQRDLGIDNLKIKYFWLTAWSQLKVYFIHNCELTAKWEYQQIWAIHIKQDVGKTNNNMNTDIELVWLCWYKYMDRLEDLYKLFNIDKNKRKILTRQDYAFDLTNITVDEVYELCKEFVGEWDIKTFNGQKTWFRIKNDRHEIAVYDKKFQIYQKDKYKETIKGDFIYKAYTDTDFNITRVEYRKNARAFGDFENNSINETMQVIRNQAISFIKKKFYLDLSFVVADYRVNKRYNECDLIRRKTLLSIKKISSKLVNKTFDKFNIWFVEKRSKLYLERGLCYLSNYWMLNSDKKLFKMLQMQYGDRIKNYFVNPVLEMQEFKAIFN